MATLRAPNTLSHEELSSLVSRLQAVLWQDHEGRIDVDASWDADTIDDVAREFHALGLAPTDARRP